MVNVVQGAAVQPGTPAVKLTDALDTQRNLSVTLVFEIFGTVIAVDHEAGVVDTPEEPTTQDLGGLVLGRRVQKGRLAGRDALGRALEHREDVREPLAVVVRLRRSLPKSCAAPLPISMHMTAWAW